MSQFIDTGYGSVVLAATVERHLRVNGDGTLAGASDQDIGCTLQRGESGDDVGVSLRNKQGTQKCVATAAFAAGALLYCAASGKVDDSGTLPRGIAMEASTGADAIVEVMPFVGIA